MEVSSPTTQGGGRQGWGKGVRGCLTGPSAPFQAWSASGTGELLTEDLPNFSLTPLEYISNVRRAGGGLSLPDPLGDQPQPAPCSPGLRSLQLPLPSRAIQTAVPWFVVLGRTCPDHREWSVWQDGGGEDTTRGGSWGLTPPPPRSLPPARLASTSCPSLSTWSPL